MSDTPRTDAVAFGIFGMEGDTGFNGPTKKYAPVEFARTLERELTEFLKQRNELWQRRHELVRDNAKLERERDEWKKCAEELAAIFNHVDPLYQHERDALERFRKLKEEK